MSFGTATFVFYGDERAVAMDFHDIADPAQAMCIRPDGQAACNADSWAGLAEAGVRFFV